MSKEIGKATEKASGGQTMTTYQLPYGGSGKVDLVVDDRGRGQPFLLLHGGAGPMSMARFAGMLAARGNVRVITPTHPGFARTTRPDDLKSIKGLAQIYAALLDRLGVSDVTVVGNSVGSWIAVELALLGSPRVSGVVLTGAVGVDIPDHPIPDASKFTLDELMSRSYHNPKPFRIDPATMTDDQRAAFAANRAALGVYAPQMTDPTLAGRLAKVAVPVLVISGESDRIVVPEYGRAYAASIPGAKFVVLPGTGHLPQIETPELLIETIWSLGQPGR
jgi:pimeloyl-ACP methyl ester carboxylesterase